MPAPVPTELRLHRERRVLEVRFDDGACFQLPCAYLRAFSPAAEARVQRAAGGALQGTAGVNITRIEPVGSYAVQLHFDDGHHSGIYSWRTLYALGRDLARNWPAGAGPAAAPAARGPARVRLLYFVSLAEAVGRGQEEVELPAEVDRVGALVGWLRRRGEAWRRGLGRGDLKITVNRQFAGPDTPIGNGDEIAIVPSQSLGGDD